MCCFGSLAEIISSSRRYNSMASVRSSGNPRNRKLVCNALTRFHGQHLWVRGRDALNATVSRGCHGEPATTPVIRHRRMSAWHPRDRAPVSSNTV